MTRTSAPVPASMSHRDEQWQRRDMAAATTASRKEAIGRMVRGRACRVVPVTWWPESRSHLFDCGYAGIGGDIRLTFPEWATSVTVFDAVIIYFPCLHVERTSASRLSPQSPAVLGIVACHPIMPQLPLLRRVRRWLDCGRERNRWLWRLDCWP